MLSSYAMEKLIELINEYYKRRYSTDKFKVDRFTNYAPTDWGHFNYVGEEYGGISEADIISKRYNFIEWLVDKGKVEPAKIKKIYRKSNENSTATYPVMYEYSVYETLLMQLAISENPINYLVSVLKE